MKTTITAIFILSILRSSAQEIAGRVLDDKKEPLMNANVLVFQNGILKGGNITDFDGIYVIKPLDSGLYNVKIFYTGFDTILVTNVVVLLGTRTTQNCILPMSREIMGCRIVAYKKPLVWHEDNDASILTNTPLVDLSNFALTREQIDHMPATTIDDLMTIFPGIYQQRRGDPISIHGYNGIAYYIDGVRQ